MEIDVSGRSGHVSTLHRVKTNKIRNRMPVKETIVNKIEKKRLKLFGQVRRVSQT